MCQPWLSEFSACMNSVAVLQARKVLRVDAAAVTDLRKSCAGVHTDVLRQYSVCACMHSHVDEAAREGCYLHVCPQLLACIKSVQPSIVTGICIQAAIIVHDVDDL